MLTYHGIPFKTWNYTPIVGETWMKAKAGKLFSGDPVTSPILLKPDGEHATCCFPSDALLVAMSGCLLTVELRRTNATGNTRTSVRSNRSEDSAAMRVQEMCTTPLKLPSGPMSTAAQEHRACSQLTNWMRSSGAGDYICLLCTTSGCPGNLRILGAVFELDVKGLCAPAVGTKSARPS